MHAFAFIFCLCQPAFCTVNQGSLSWPCSVVSPPLLLSRCGLEGLAWAGTAAPPRPPRCRTRYVCSMRSTRYPFFVCVALEIIGFRAHFSRPPTPWQCQRGVAPSDTLPTLQAQGKARGGAVPGSARGTPGAWPGVPQRRGTYLACLGPAAAPGSASRRDKLSIRVPLTGSDPAGLGLRGLRTRRKYPLQHALRTRRLVRRPS